MRTQWLVLAVLSLFPQAATAQSDVLSQRAVDAYEDLYNAVTEGGDHQAALDNLVTATAEQMILGDPELAEAEKEYPGLMDDIAEAMRPIFFTRSERIQGEYRPRMIALLGQLLSVEEASDIARFYRSEIGRLLALQVSRQSDRRQTLTDAVAQREASLDSVTEDSTQTAERATAALTDDQQRELVAAVAETPALAKMAEFNARALPLRTEMINTPLTDAEEAEIVRVVNAAFENRVASD